MQVMTQVDLFVCLSLQILVLGSRLWGFARFGLLVLPTRRLVGPGSIRTKFGIARIGRVDGQILQPLPDVLGRACVVDSTVPGIGIVEK